MSIDQKFNIVKMAIFPEVDLQSQYNYYKNTSWFWGVLLFYFGFGFGLVDIEELILKF